MKQFTRTLLPMLVLATLFVSACAGVPAQAKPDGAAKVQAAPLEFTGMIESIVGNVWTLVGGQVITVDPSVLDDGPFVEGDTVDIEAEVQEDGTVVVIGVEASSGEDDSNDNINENDDDANENDDVNENDDDTNENDNDVNENDDDSNENDGLDDDDNSNDDEDEDEDDDNSNDDNSNDD